MLGATKVPVHCSRDSASGAEVAALVGALVGVLVGASVVGGLVGALLGALVGVLLGLGVDGFVGALTGGEVGKIAASVIVRRSEKLNIVPKSGCCMSLARSTLAAVSSVLM